MKRIIVCGAGGFIGHHLAKRLKDEGNHVIGLDLKPPDFSNIDCATEFHIHDCRKGIESYLNKDVDEVYQLAADMGGAEYIFTGKNDYSIMSNSAKINIEVLNSCKDRVGKLFYSSSACIYPEYNQKDPENPNCREESAYPAQPDSEYGWEKLFSERLYLSFYKNNKIPVSIARFHNVYGPECAYNNGKEKAILAICRKVLEADKEIQIFGSGNQTRSFLYIDDCVDGILAVMRNSVALPLNVGSEEMISINELAIKIMSIAGKKLFVQNIDGPIGVNGRTSENSLVKSITGWEPKINLDEGLKLTINWLKTIYNII